MVSLKAEQREVFGKKLQEWRRIGKLPGIIYGPGIKKSIPVFVNQEEFKKVFKEAHETDFIDLFLEKGKKSVLIKDIELDPVEDTPIHVDFFMPRMDKPIEAKVPLVFEGESQAVKNFGGVLVKVVHEIEVKGLPKDIPHQIEVPLSLLQNLEDRIIIKDVKFPSGVSPLAKEDEVVALAATPEKEEIPEVSPSLEEIEVAGKEKKEEEKKEEETKEEKKEGKK